MKTVYNLVGKVGKPHGYIGKFKLYLFTPPPVDPLPPYLFLAYHATYVPFRLVSWQQFKPIMAIVQLAGITTVRQVIDLKDCEVFLPKTEVKVTSASLINSAGTCTGYLVEDLLLGKLGKVKEIAMLGSQQMLVADYREKELYIPFPSPLINAIDRKERKITTSLPKGYLAAFGLA